MHTSGAKSLRIEQASQHGQAAALGLLLSRIPDGDRPRHVDAWAAVLATGQAHLWIAQRLGKLAGTILAQVQPGRTAVVLPPRQIADEPTETSDALLTHVAEMARSEGVKLLQAALRPDERDDACRFAAAGYHHVSDLSYLVSLNGCFPSVVPQSALEFVPCSATGMKRLARMVEQSYQGSLDCPPVDGHRAIDDVLAGYRAIGQFDASHWLVARHEQRDVGCLLLGDHPGENGCELIYMGLKPAARGRQFGLALVRHAQWLTARAGRSRLTTAVDEANAPAIAIYRATQFIEYDRREVWLKVP